MKNKLSKLEQLLWTFIAGMGFYAVLCLAGEPGVIG